MLKAFEIDSYRVSCMVFDTELCPLGLYRTSSQLDVAVPRFSKLLGSTMR
jgi:hypothetical protein